MPDFVSTHEYRSVGFASHADMLDFLNGKTKYVKTWVNGCAAKKIEGSYQYLPWPDPRQEGYELAHIYTISGSRDNAYYLMFRKQACRTPTI